MTPQEWFVLCCVENMWKAHNQYLVKDVISQRIELRWKSNSVSHFQKSSRTNKLSLYTQDSSRIDCTCNHQKKFFRPEKVTNPIYSRWSRKCHFTSSVATTRPTPCSPLLKSYPNNTFFSYRNPRSKSFNSHVNEELSTSWQATFVINSTSYK